MSHGAKSRINSLPNGLVPRAERAKEWPDGSENPVPIWPRERILSTFRISLLHARAHAIHIFQSHRTRRNTITDISFMAANVPEDLVGAVSSVSNLHWAAYKNAVDQPL